MLGPAPAETAIFYGHTYRGMEWLIKHIDVHRGGFSWFGRFRWIGGLSSWGDEGGLWGYDGWCGLGGLGGSGGVGGYDGLCGSGG